MRRRPNLRKPIYRPDFQRKNTAGDCTLNFYFSVMKKSKMDWEAHRKKDNLEEELNNVKNSKKSIVDKNDFLLRTDHRTFELEREERLKRINNRKNN